MEHITNEEVFRKAGEKCSFLKSLKSRKIKLIGHNGFLARLIEDTYNRKKYIRKTLARI